MRLSLLTLILLGVFWRTHGLFTNTFFTDEALFASWARLIAVWRDPLLSSVPLDKPPLLFYVQALFYPLQGPVPWAARLPNWIASIFTIPLVGVLTGRLAPHTSMPAAVAVFLVAFSPLAAQFAPTAFTDPLLVFWIILAAVLATRRQDQTGSAIASGLALWTKYQAVLFIPLIFIIWWQFRPQKESRAITIIPWAGSMGLMGLLLVGWDVARAGRWTLWSSQLTGIGGLRPARSWELGYRLLEIGPMVWWIFAVGWLVALGGVFAWRRLGGQIWWCGEPEKLFIPPWIELTVVGYIGVHWLAAVPIWDRYWLPLVPWAAVWVGVRFFAGSGRVNLLQRTTLLGLMVLLLLPQGMQARRAGFPVGGQPSADGGAGRIAAVLADKPYGTVLYDNFYSWQWRYYFFDTGVFVSWFPSPDWFGRELQAFGQSPGQRYLVLPVDARGSPVRRTASELGYELVEIAQAGEMILYRIQPPER